MLRAISSVGERFLHTEEVVGSIPTSPTNEKQAKVEIKFELERWLETSADRYWPHVGCLDKLAKRTHLRE